ncbi:MAG: peroxiredoxin family protein [Actinomycetota bacterium]
MRTLRTGWAAATAFAVVLWAGSGFPQGTPAQKAEERAEVGFLAPDFTLPDPSGARVKLSDFRGKKAVFLNFWASWCPSCQEEMPTMETLYREFKPRGLEILAVSIDTRTGDVATFTKMHGVTFPALLDPDQKVFKQYRASKIPTHVLIDRSGVIRAREVGSKDWSRPETWKAIEALLR